MRLPSPLADPRKQAARLRQSRISPSGSAGPKGDGIEEEPGRENCLRVDSEATEEGDEAVAHDDLAGDPHPARYIRTLDDRCRKPWAKRPSGFGVNHQLKTRSTTRLAALPSASPQ